MLEEGFHDKAAILKGYLSKLEILLYLIVWISAIAYSIYSFFIAQNGIYHSLYMDFYNDFRTGWTWVNRQIDSADTEWINGMKVIDLMLPFLIVHFIISEILKIETPELLPFWHTITGSVFIVLNVGWTSLAIFFSLPILFFYFNQFSSKILIWIPSILIMLTLHYVSLTMENYGDEFQLHFTAVTIAWINLRCLSYFLDAIQEKRYREWNIKNLFGVLGYCLYLPLLYFGPIINYSDFTAGQWDSSDKKDRKPMVVRAKKLIFNLIRFSFWTFVVHLFLHFFYVNAMLFQIDFIRDFNGFALYGFGYLMGQFFHMKYVVFYGLSTALTQFELEIPVPPTPKCIARIHLYSEMWKYFDRGLYLFLVKYIYKPSLTRIKKPFASLITFMFIFLWHGLHPCLLIWSTLNYIGVSLESLCSYAVKSDRFQNSVLNRLSDNNKRRFNCLIATPLFIMSILSNFYFFSGRNCGDVFVYKFLNGTPLFQFVITCILYCGSQIATEIQLLENYYKVKQMVGLVPEQDVKDNLCSGDHKLNLDEKIERPTRPPLQKRYRSRSNSPRKLYEKFHKTCEKLNSLGISNFNSQTKKSIETIISQHKLKQTESIIMDDIQISDYEFKQFIDEIKGLDLDELSESMVIELEKKIDELLNVDETKLNEFNKVL